MNKMAQLTMLLLLLFFLSPSSGRNVNSASFLHTNNEIESCIVQIHSESKNTEISPVTSALLQNGGANNILFGNGNVLSSNKVNAPPVTSEHSTIICQIRTLHPDLSVENLTATLPSVELSEITRLKLVCNDVLFFESSLSPGQLSGLGELHELNIEKCKLKHLPSDMLAGLRHLRRLTVNTGNSDWAARSLEISPGAFANVPQLRHVHLGYNHMWNLPDVLLCALHSLQSLNLTHNLLSDIDDLGLPRKPMEGKSANEFNSDSGNCLGELKSFDLSYNSLRTLGSGRLDRLKRLAEFRVDHNWLEEIEDDAFYGLSQLRLLNLSSNRLVALPPKLFQPVKLLRELDLRNNSLTALSPGLLTGLEHLVTLDLSLNQLSSQWITSEAFKSLVRVVILNLSNNQLTHLSPTTFHDLYSLQVLDLGNNLISTIEDETFAPMSNLHSLNLGRNRLVVISANMFNGLYVLHKLILDYNQLAKIEVGAMRNCTSLQDLGLVGNKLVEIPEALRGLALLRTLDLGDNRISTLHNESFTGMGQLYGIRLVDNQLEEIPKGFCDSINRLRVLNVAQNRITKISNGAFVSCPELRVLRLDSNKLENIPQTLAPQLPNLLWLNVTENSIRWVDYSLLPSTLEWFGIAYNKLETLGGVWAPNNSRSTTTNLPISKPATSYNNLLRLRVVDASHNQLTQLDYHAVPPSLEILKLSHNKLRKIYPETFSRSVHLRRVELISNQLENIPLNALRLPIIPPGRPLPEFFLGGNVFLCDCEMEWLTRTNQLSALRQHPTVLDLDSIVCRLTYSRTQTHIPLPDIKPQDFLCPYKSHCFALCQCCEFDACDCEMTCPSNCSCFHDDTWSANTVNCANSGHTAIPSRLPMDSTEVYLDGNTIPILKSHTFIGRKNLRVLYLNSSQIDTISNKSFNGLQSLQTLHLEGNKLKALYGYEFDHLSRLRELYLHDNLIEKISNTTFLPLKSLEILRLDGNRLVTFTVWQLSLNPYLVEIGLARNEWNCDCQFLHQLYAWVTDNSRKVVDLTQLQCVWNTTHQPGPHLIDYNRTCGSSWTSLIGIDSAWSGNENLVPLILGVVTLLVVIIIAILVVICRENLRLWIFTRFGLRVCPSGNASGNTEDKSYDTYLLYSQKDEEFVTGRISDELESNDNYRLCLHYRDLISETGDLKDMMIGAVDSCKSLLIVLSRNFIQGEWSSGEFRGAFHAVMKKCWKKDFRFKNRKPVIIILVDDIPQLELSPDLRTYVSNSNVNVIKWSPYAIDQRKNKKFWSKLKYSLPDPSSHYHSNITNTTTSTSSEGNTNGNIPMSTPQQQQLKTNGLMDGRLNEQLVSESDFLSSPQHANYNYLQTQYQEQLSNYQLAQLAQYQSRNMIVTANANGSMSKLWPYSPSTFVALPPNSPRRRNSPISKSPPVTASNSSQSTESTTDCEPSNFYNNNCVKSPVPKRVNPNDTSANGESYLSIEGEQHIYSTLDPPSPQPLANHHQQQLTYGQNNVLNNIHLPNGYTYQPQLPPQQLQWNSSGSVSTSNYNSGQHHHRHHHKKKKSERSGEQPKQNNEPSTNGSVQTYLV